MLCASVQGWFKTADNNLLLWTQHVYYIHIRETYTKRRYRGSSLSCPISIFMHTFTQRGACHQRFWFLTSFDGNKIHKCSVYIKYAPFYSTKTIILYIRLAGGQWGEYQYIWQYKSTSYCTGWCSKQFIKDNSKITYWEVLDSMLNMNIYYFFLQFILLLTV